MPSARVRGIRPKIRKFQLRLEPFARKMVSWSDGDVFLLSRACHHETDAAADLPVFPDGGDRVGGLSADQNQHQPAGFFPGQFDGCRPKDAAIAAGGTGRPATPAAAGRSWLWR